MLPSHFREFTTFWSCNPLNLTAKREKNNRLFSCRHKHIPQLSLPVYLLCISMDCSISFSLLFASEPWQWCIQFRPKEVLNLDHGRDFTMTYGDKLVSLSFLMMPGAHCTLCSSGGVDISVGKLITLQPLHLALVPISLYKWQFAMLREYYQWPHCTVYSNELVFFGCRRWC